ncbi:MAG TPA: alcohol dehydrogenase catalytic domain-containing protein [Acidimicrobiales bacterium]|nr:alcohol dehydrogenase catalytic domain-containing protein [Acidimicrobiales bacterium]
MRAAVLTGPGGRLETAVVDDPAPGPGQVVARVTACGICGSDLHIAAAYGMPGSILGHEIAGVVETVGAEVDGRWKPGTAVTARPFTSCGACDWCVGGRPDHCTAFSLLGFTSPGGFAERVVLSAAELFVLPASVTGPEQALIEPLAVALHGLRRAGVQSGEPVAVLGAGPIGLATTAWARALGVGPVVVSEPAPARRILASALGAAATVDPGTGDLAGACGDALGGPPRVVMECSGKPGMIEAAMQLAAVDGRVGVVGACMVPDTIFPFTGLHKELDVRFALYYDRRDFVDTLRALEDHTLVVHGLVTDVVDLDGLPDMFAGLSAGADTGKVVVTP